MPDTETPLEIAKRISAKFADDGWDPDYELFAYEDMGSLTIGQLRALARAIIDAEENLQNVTDAMLCCETAIRLPGRFSPEAVADTLRDAVRRCNLEKRR